MSQILFSNLASTTLAVAMSSGASSLNVAAGTGVLFPNPGAGQFFKITITPATGSTPAPEILHVTAVSSDTFTVLRGQEGTTAQAWGVNSIVDNLLTRDTMAAFQQMMSYSGNPNTYVAGQAGSGGVAPTWCWDLTDGIAYVCTTSGSAFSAVWTPYYGGVAFTPVQQNGGIRQLTDKIYIGNTSTGVGVTADTTDLGDIAFVPYVNNQISAEATTRASADTTLQNNINSEAYTRATADTYLSNTISTETSNRASADTTLQNNINAEASTRYTADVNEANARYGADVTLQNNINAEATARANADALLFPSAGGVITGAVTISGGPLEVSGTTSTTASGWQMNPGGTGSFSAGVTQSIHTSNDIVASRFIAASDGRVKSDIRLVDAAYAKKFVQRVQAHTYVKNGQMDAGFIAQHMLEAGYPELVIVGSPVLDKNGVVVDGRLAEVYNGFSGPKDALLSVKEGMVPAILATVVRDLMEQIELMSNQLEMLRKKVDAA